FAQVPSARVLRESLNKHTENMRQYGQTFLFRRNGKPTFHQEILDVLRDKKVYNVTTAFKDKKRFGKSHPNKKLTEVFYRGYAAQLWVIEKQVRDHKLIRLQPFPNVLKP